jgi:Spy/CpxP family protein refolding chaperone
MIRFVAGAALLVTASVALAEQGHRPYAGLEQRAVKALSDDEIADLRAGRGMRLALAAELNGYAGPLHVLELAEALGLTAEQRRHTQELYDAMKDEAVLLGERLIAQESELDRAFATRTITRERLDRLTGTIGETRAALRAAHLKYHLAQDELLTPQQRARYATLRGYTPQAPPHGHDPRRHHGPGRH